MAARKGTFYKGTKSANSSNASAKKKAFAGLKPIAKKAKSASAAAGGGTQRRDPRGRFA